MLSGSMRPGTVVSGVSRTDVSLATEAAVMPLQERVESLELACAGLWELLKFKLGATDDELIAAIRDVDARDGTVDGKITPDPARSCPKCGRKALVRRSAKCAWCGADLGAAPFPGAKGTP